MMKWRDYVKVLAEWYIPSQVTGTKLNSSTVEWSEGEERNLEHNCWRIATANPEKKRKNVSHQISFDAPIAFPSITLADPKFLSDNLIKKQLVLQSLTLGIGSGGGLDAHVVAQIARRHDWLIRFKAQKGVQSNSDLTSEHLLEFIEALVSGEVLALIPVHDYLSSLADQTIRSPIYDLIFEDGRILDWSAVASLLGVTPASITRSRLFPSALVETHSSLFEDHPNLIGLFEGRGERRVNVTLDETDLPLGIDDDELAEGDYAQGLTRKNLAHYLDNWNYLSIMSERSEIHDKLSFLPFLEKSIDQLVVKYQNSNKGRTPTLMPEDLFRVMVLASRWVCIYAEYIILSLEKTYQIRRYPNLRGKHTAESEAMRPVGAPHLILALTAGRASKLQNPNTLYILDAVMCLLAAAAILFLSIGFRRSGEASSVREGCLVERKPGLLELSVYIEKTKRDVGEVPVPEIIRNVVEVLQKLSANTRRQTGTPWLFDVALNEDAPNHLVSTKFNETINKLVKFSELTPPEGFDHWHLTTHQFRRGMGIWYYHGLLGASADPLSRLYYHFDPRMTRIYFNLLLPGMINRLKDELALRLHSSRVNRTTEDKNWISDAYTRLSEMRGEAANFDEARCEMFVAKMIGLWMGTETVVGAGGAALFANVTAIVNLAKASIRIGSRSNDPDGLRAPVLEQCKKFVQTHFLEPVIGTNVFCTVIPGNEADLGDALCLKSKSDDTRPWIDRSAQSRPSIPDFDYALNPVCVACPKCAIFKDGLQKIEHEVAEFGRVAERGATVALRSQAEARYQAYKLAVIAAKSYGEGQL